MVSISFLSQELLQLVQRRFIWGVQWLLRVVTILVRLRSTPQVRTFAVSVSMDTVRISFAVVMMAGLVGGVTPAFESAPASMALLSTESVSAFQAGLDRIAMWQLVTVIVLLVFATVLPVCVLMVLRRTRVTRATIVPTPNPSAGSSATSVPDLSQTVELEELQRGALGPSRSLSSAHLAVVTTSGAPGRAPLPHSVVVPTTPTCLPKERSAIALPPLRSMRPPQ